jgi:hypothetical protein
VSQKLAFSQNSFFDPPVSHCFHFSALRIFLRALPTAARHAVCSVIVIFIISLSPKKQAIRRAVVFDLAQLHTLSSQARNEPCDPHHPYRMHKSTGRCLPLHSFLYLRY